MKPISKYPLPSILILLFFINGLLGCIEYDDELEESWNPSYNTKYNIEIIRVIDGDTISVKLPNGAIDTIRFLGIDTPELYEENNHENEYRNIVNISCLTTYANIAKKFVENIVVQADCYILFDEKAGVKDPYQRWLCYVYVNTEDINVKLLENGLARVYISETFEKKDYYIELQNIAINNNSGLWDCS